MEKIEFKKGFTWRAFAAIIFGCLIVEPALIYYLLVSGGGQPYGPWLVLIIWAGILSFMGKDLTVQEAFIINSFGAAMVMTGFMGLPYEATGAGLFLYPIQNMIYYTSSPITIAFGITRQVPSWYAPSFNSLIVKGTVRTFFDPSLIIPQTIMIVDSVLGIMMGISLAFLNFQLFVREEKLEFPIYSAFVGGFVALSSEGKGMPRQVLMISTFIGFLYGAAAWVIPIFFPWLPMIFGGFYPGMTTDLTYFLEQGGLRGASLGIFNDVYAIALGFVTPFFVVALMWIGAFATYFLGNMLLVKFDLWTDPTEIGSWISRSSAAYCAYWSNLRFWMMAIIGISLALAIIPQIRHPGPLIRSFKSLAKTASGSEEQGMFSIKIILTLFLIASIASTILTHLLVPDFPIWIVVALVVGWSFIATFVASNIAGVTGGLQSIPWVREGVIVGSGYPNWDIWFAPIQMNTLGASLCAQMKQAVMTRTLISDYIKAFLFTITLTFVFSFVYMSLFWNIAPIPSVNYPATINIWQIAVQNRNLTTDWLKTGRFFNLNLLFGSFATGTVVYLVSDYLGFRGVLPSILGGITSGLGFMPPIIWTTSMMIGAFLGKYAFSRVLGTSRWNKWKGTIFSGLSAGNSIALIFMVGLISATKAQWVMPY